MRGSEDRHQPNSCCSRIVTTYRNPNMALVLRSSASILFLKVEQRVCRSWSGCLERDPPLNLSQKVSSTHGGAMLKVSPAQHMPHSGHNRQLPDRVLAQYFHHRLTTYLQFEYQKHLYPHAASPSLFLYSHQKTSLTCCLSHTTYQIVTAEEVAPMTFDAPALAMTVHHRRTL